MEETIVKINKQEITEEIKEKIKTYIETNDNPNNDPKPMGYCESSSKREVYSNRNLPQETRKISRKQSNLIPKAN